MRDIVNVINYGFAWLSVLLAVLLGAVYVTRRIARAGSNPACAAVSWLDRVLRNAHVSAGIILVTTGLVHGVASSQTVWSFNAGTLCWILSVLLGVNYLLRKKLKKLGGWMVFHRLLTVLFLLSIAWHVADVGGIRAFGLMQRARQSAQSLEAPVPGTEEGASGNGALPSGPQAKDASLFDGAVLKDGVYTGTADGYGPGLTVSVTVENGRVSHVEVISHNEQNDRYYAYPIETIPQAIVENQSLHVDVVSGATCTSQGIIDAVYDALQAAVTDGALS